MSRSLILFLIITAGAALGLRWPSLEHRPAHNDEAVNAIKAARLWESGDYRYDPNEHHGPTLYYFSAWLNHLTRTEPSTTTLRSVTVLFGLGTILLLFFLRDGLGTAGAAFSALLLATSPSFVYYSRYYIHEMLLIAFAMLALAGGWRYYATRSVPWLILAGAGVGLMHGTKETFVISLGGAFGALVLGWGWSKRFAPGSEPKNLSKSLQNTPFYSALFAAAWITVALLFFTSFFTNASGPVDSVKTYLPWLNRAAGDSPHIHPWYFYLHRLFWFHPQTGPVFTELGILALAVVGGYSGFARRGTARHVLVRFLVFYSVLVLVAYSAISYKTPWCLLNFWHGLVLLAGVGAAFLLESARRNWMKALAAAAVLLVCGHLGWQSWLLNGAYAADRRNPHVYAHTSADLQRMVQRIHEIAATGPGRELNIKVISPEADYWPLPWELRTFPAVGYYESLPRDPYADIMVLAAGLEARLDDAKTHLMVGYFELRPEVHLELYVELGVWKNYLARRPPPPDDDDS